MPDIHHVLLIHAPRDRVFRAVSHPPDLDRWWTKQSSGDAAEGAPYALGFGPDHQWRERVTRCEPDAAFELELTDADPDWAGSRVGFVLEEERGGTQLRFTHRGWRDDNDHYRISCYCWAMYLRILKRYVEHGETVPYEQRLEV